MGPMDGTMRTYLELAAVDAVGAALLDPRPAFVCAGDGTRLLWANVAGTAFFGKRAIDDLLAQPISALNPLKGQCARLARLLPSDRARLEILRVGFGVNLVTLPAACQRLNLADGTVAILAVAAAAATAESLTGRAERLVAAMASEARPVAVAGPGGKILAASPGFAAPASDRRIDALVASADRSGKGLAELALVVGDEERAVTVVRFDAAGPCHLIVGGAPRSRKVEPEREPVALETAADAVPPAPLPAADKPLEAPVAKPEPTATFTWQTDGDRRFTFVSPDLATAVGADNAAVIGKTWGAVAALLDLDPDGAVDAALASPVPWTATVYWPLAEGGARIAVDLTGLPLPSPAGASTGFRGFGRCRPGERRADERVAAMRLSDLRSATAQTAPLPDAGEEAPAGAGQTADLDDAARMSVEEAPASGADEVAEGAAAGQASNVIRLPGSPSTTRTPERLSGSEADAFRRIAEALAAGKGGERPQANDRAGAKRPAQPPPAHTAAVSIDSRLLDLLPVGIAITREERLLFANRALLDLLGHASVEEFAAAGGLGAMFPGRGKDWTREPIGEAGSLTARRRDGAVIHVTARLNTVQWGAASALMLTIAPRGGKERTAGLVEKLAAAQARADELDAILDTATDGVLVVDRAGTIGAMNRAAEALFGVEAGGLIGHPFTELFAEESGKPALDYLDGLAANGVASVLNDGREVIGSVPQGGLIPLFMTMGRIGESGKFCAVLRDITYWKTVEEELTAARHAAEVANVQKSEFLAKVSHEIRTPLNAIIGFAEVMMEQRFGPIGNERYRTYLGDIHKSGAHLMSLINDLLDLSKIEAGQLDLSFESLPVNGAIQECVALMQPQANRQRIIIRTSLSVDVPDIVADRRSFRQILLNLLSNAIKFTRPGGQVIVSSTLEPSGEVVVRIRDTGIGMSEKDIDTAMKPFRQVAAAKEGGDKGTGLGLPLTKALVEANRARLEIDSAID